MKYYKLIDNGYIVLIGIGCGGTEITEKEYNGIMTVIQSKPEAQAGHDYKLKANLTWELYELPPAEE